MIHSLVIRTMNLLTIDARKKKLKFVFKKRKFLSVRIDLKNVCFKGETLNTSRFLNLVVTIRYGDLDKISLPGNQKPRENGSDL